MRQGRSPSIRWPMIEYKIDNKYPKSGDVIDDE